MAKAKITKMKALSIIQPWASCIATKGKNIENRDWETLKRGYFAVHSSKAKDLDRFDRCRELYGVKLDPEAVPYGCIVAFVKLSDVVTRSTVSKSTKKWFQGDFGFVLKNPIRLKKPIPVKGSLGFWTLKGKTLKLCLAQLSPAQKKRVLGSLMP